MSKLYYNFIYILNKWHPYQVRFILLTYLIAPLTHPSLARMDKQQLVQFMIKKGNERKRDQCEQAQALTRDSQDHYSSIIASLNARVVAK